MSIYYLSWVQRPVNSVSNDEYLDLINDNNNDDDDDITHNIYDTNNSCANFHAVIPKSNLCPHCE